jgi:hypothetical protein
MNKLVIINNNNLNNRKLEELRVYCHNLVVELMQNETSSSLKVAPIL